jgi:hypothetical protein
LQRFLKRRPSPAMVVALTALFLSLGGVSYGVATGSIDSREIKNNNVRSGDLRNNDVRTRDLRNNDVRGRDVRNSTLTGSDVGADKLTGSDILESGLGKVPSASSADSANSAGNADTLDGNDSGAFVRQTEKLWARVASNGTLRGGSGAISVTRTAAGRYNVTFNRDVSTCAWVSSTDFRGSGDGWGVHVDHGSPPDPNQVRVLTSLDTSATVDQPFSVAVLC